MYRRLLYRGKQVSLGASRRPRHNEEEQAPHWRRSLPERCLQWPEVRYFFGGVRRPNYGRSDLRVEPRMSRALAVEVEHAQRS